MNQQQQTKLHEMETDLVGVKYDITYIKESVDSIKESVRDMGVVLNELARIQTKQTYLEEILVNQRTEIQDIKKKSNETELQLNTFKTRVTTGVAVFGFLLSLFQVMVGAWITDKMSILNNLEKDHQRVIGEVTKIQSEIVRK